MAPPKKTQTTTILLSTEEGIYSCVFLDKNHQIVTGGESGQILMYDIVNLLAGTTIVTVLRDSDNNLSVRCRYCDKVFDILEDKLGNIVKCPYCDEKLQIIEKEKKEKGFFSRLFKR